MISDLELGNKVLTDYSAVLLAGVGQITASEADRLRDYVEHGGTLMFFMGDAVDKENYNSMLLPRKLIPGPLVKLVSVGTDQRGAVRFQAQRRRQPIPQRVCPSAGVRIRQRPGLHVLADRTPA